MKTSIWGCALAALFLAAFSHAPAKADSITVSSPRPVAEAVREIEQIYLVPINFEEIHPFDKNDLSPNERGQLIKSEDKLTFEYEAPPKNAPLGLRKQLALQVLSKMLKADAAQYGPYRSTDVGGVLTVQAVDDGALSYPFLDAIVTIEAKQQSAYSLVENIANQISKATLRTVTTGSLPNPLFYQHTTSLGTTGPARLVLGQLLKEIPVGYASERLAGGGTRDIPSVMAWQVLCGAPDTPCVINIHVVAPKDRGVFGQEIVSIQTQ